MKTEHGFELIHQQNIAEMSTRAALFRHVKTGAELLSLENNDEHKAFGITFRTLASDSTGLPHIMEHAVLGGGSSTYPAKDPLFELLKGSLNTHLNAETCADKTFYSMASLNVKDLYNLIHVYLDAVFHPLLLPQTFAQDAWHYELESPEAPLRLSGIVLNEMKGFFSSPDMLLFVRGHLALFPDTPCGVMMIGEPAEIPNLTYEQFKSFHETFYHPANARLFCYGDDDPEERLRFLGAYLESFETAKPAPELPQQAPFEQPRRLTIPYDAEDDAPASSQGFISINWGLPQALDPETTLGLAILEHILVGSPAAPLQRALIDSGLGDDLTEGGLNRRDFPQMTFSTGLRGIAVQNAQQVETLIVETLRSLVRDGIAPEIIEAAINAEEFELREGRFQGSSEDFPHGLTLMLHSLASWCYDGDPIAPLAFELPLNTIKQKLASGEPYFEDLLTRYFVENTHRVTVLLEPDPELGRRRHAAEEDRLAQIRAAMSAEEINTVVERTKALQQRQDTPDSHDALATLPTLTLNDLERNNRVIPLEHMNVGETEVLYHDLSTNGIVYLDLGFDLHTLPQELLPYAALFGQVLVKIGTEREDFVTLSTRIGRKTGGIKPSLLLTAMLDSPQSAAWLFLRGKATVEQADDLFGILRDILLTVNLDNRERFKQIVLEAKAQKEAQLVPEGDWMVETRLRAHVDESGWMSEQSEGISVLAFLRQLLHKIESDWPSVLATLEETRRILLNRNSMLCNVTVDHGHWTACQSKLTALLEALPSAPVAPVAWVPERLPNHEGLIVPASINYVGKGANLYALGYSSHGSALVITNYLETEWLLRKIRVQGGAYDASCDFDPFSGSFSFLSYRDPNLSNTLDIYDRTSQFLSHTNLDEKQLRRCIIGAIGRMDQYRRPDDKGYTSMVRYLTGLTDERRQQIRDEVFSTTNQEIQAFAGILEQVREKGHVVVMGSQDAIERVNSERGDWLDISHIR